MKRRASLLIMCALLVAGGSSAATEMVSMRDGIHLATDVFLPDGEGPWPAILLRSPYGRLALGDLTRMGYVVVSQDMRGYGGSEGLRTPFETDGWGELQDGYDTLEWISAQPWSDGRVGTWGGSALGITQNLLAGSHPEGLSCQFILAGASDLYSQMFFQGGAYRKSMIEGWWRDNGRPSHLAELLAHPSYDARWAPMNSDRRAAGMSCAGLHVGGWYDIFLQGTLNAFMERQHAGGEGSRGEQKLVMGHGTTGASPQPNRESWPILQTPFTPRCGPTPTPCTTSTSRDPPRDGRVSRR
jgi:predicted acyl esterase